MNLYGKISRVEKGSKSATFSVAGQIVVLEKGIAKNGDFAKVKDGLRVEATAEADVMNVKGEDGKKTEQVVWFVKSFIIPEVQEYKEKL